MYVLDVIPLALLPRPQAQILSYFHTAHLPRGAVVEVALRRRKVQAVIIGSDTVKVRRIILRKDASFELKNISRVINPISQVTRWQFEIAQHIATQYYTPLGTSLKTVLPPFWNKRGYSIINAATDKKKGKQKFILCAEQTKVKYFAKKYKNQNPLTISSSTKNKNYYEIWNAIQNGSAELIIGTRVGLFLPYQNLESITVDDESNNMYKSDMTPRYNAADLAQYIAKLHGAEVIYEVVVPRLDSPMQTRFFVHSGSSPSPARLRMDEVQAGGSHKKSLRGRVQSLKKPPKIVDMIREIKDANFSIFSRHLKDALMTTREKNQNIILYIPRRGHANFILCQTCGKTLTCPNCSTSLVLHATDEKHLRCHHCDYQQQKPKTCPNCKGYSLKPKGIGIQKS